MSEKFEYYPKGTCSKKMEFIIEDDKLINTRVIGGCDGNLKGICKLVNGMKIDDVIDKLSGINCGFKPTSCPDQLARALAEYKDSKR